MKEDNMIRLESNDAEIKLAGCVMIVLKKRFMWLNLGIDCNRILRGNVYKTEDFLRFSHLEEMKRSSGPRKKIQ